MLFYRLALAPVVMVKMDTTEHPEGTEEMVKMAKMVLRSSIPIDEKRARKYSSSYFPTGLNRSQFLCPISFVFLFSQIQSTEGGGGGG